MQTLSLREAVFQRLRFIDVELAEDLFRRMPEVTSVTELNQFMHQLLGQYEQDTLLLRMALQDHEFNTWYTAFAAVVVPFFVTNRLPPMTNRNTPATYGDNMSPIKA